MCSSDLIGQELIDNRSLFLSQRAAKSFGGYAGAQLRRLQNAIARDSMPQAKRERHILNSVQNTLEDFQRQYGNFAYGSIHLYLDQAVTAGMDTEIFVDASQTHMPLRDFQKMFGALNNVIRDYDKIGKRNKKKDDDHLNKHAMHLIRLFLMAIDILEQGKIKTHRREDAELLLSIRNGRFLKEDGTFDAEFYQILGEYETRLKSAVQNSILPKQPDMAKVEAFVESVNQRAVEMEF